MTAKQLAKKWRDRVESIRQEDSGHPNPEDDWWADLLPGWRHQDGTISVHAYTLTALDGELERCEVGPSF